MNRIRNLDTLRFIAASLVVLQHIELYKASAYTQNYWDISFIRMAGSLGVVMFFVLSSFLITTLLLNEKESTGAISLKAFYSRRVLRIWPLYYLIIFLGFFVLPHISIFQMPAAQNRFDLPAGNDLFPNFYFYLSGLSSLGRTLYGDIAFVSHTWTLTTEQLFYLIWPLVVLFFHRKLFGAIVLIIILYHALSYFLITKYAYAVPYSRFIFSFLSGFYIQCMAYGSLFAIIARKKEKLLNFLQHPVVFYSAIIASIGLAFVLKNFIIYHYDIYSVLFGIIILNLASNPRYADVLENKITNHLGKISYGIYMYHPILVVISIKLALIAGSGVFIYLFSFLGAFAVAHLSYKYFEAHFLKLKPKRPALSM